MRLVLWIVFVFSIFAVSGCWSSSQISHSDNTSLDDVIDNNEKFQMTPLLMIDNDNHHWYATDGVDLYRNEMSGIPYPDPIYQKVDGAIVHSSSLLDTGAIKGCRGTMCNRQWLVSGDDLWFEWIHLHVDVNTFQVRADLSCQDTITFAEDKDNFYLINNKDGIEYARLHDRIRLETDDSSSNRFTVLYDLTTKELYVFSAIESAPRTACAYSIIPDVSENFIWSGDYQSIPSTITIQDNENVYRVTDNWY